MNFLVDANILSEATRPDPEKKVIEWMRSNESHLVVNPIILGELEYGILLLPEGKRRTSLELWFRATRKRLPVIDFDSKCAGTWAALLSKLRREGRSMPIKDSLIAATALAYDLKIATRNAKDFQNTELHIENPFSDS